MPMRLHYAPDRMADGDAMAFTMWLGPIPVRWVARVEGVSGSGFADHQERGPFEAWTHRHTFVKEDEDTTRIEDEVEARLKQHPLWRPAGPAMWLGLPLLFTYRGWKTRRLLEALPADKSSGILGD